LTTTSEPGGGVDGAMADFLFLMHDDAMSEDDSAWGPYLARLEADGALRGGSAIGTGVCVCKYGHPPAVTSYVTGFVRIVARDLEHARSMVAGNPVYEGGGTVEIRELPRTD
jgi:hypothetical protein